MKSKEVRDGKKFIDNFFMHNFFLKGICRLDKVEYYSGNNITPFYLITVRYVSDGSDGPDVPLKSTVYVYGN